MSSIGYDLLAVPEGWPRERRGSISAELRRRAGQEFPTLREAAAVCVYRAGGLDSLNKPGMCICLTGYIVSF